jgi:hypothetical protein
MVDRYVWAFVYLSAMITTMYVLGRQFDAWAIAVDKYR